MLVAMPTGGITPKYLLAVNPHQTATHKHHHLQYPKHGALSVRAFIPCEVSNHNMGCGTPDAAVQS